MDTNSLTPKTTRANTSDPTTSTLPSIKARETECMESQFGATAQIKEPNSKMNRAVA